MARGSASTRPLGALLVVMVAAGVGAAAAPFQTTGDATAPPTTVAASGARTATLYAAASVEPPPPSATTAATAAEPVTGAAATTTTTAVTTTVPPSDRDAATWVQTTADARTPYRVELDVRGLRLDVVRGGRVVRSVNVVLGAAPPTVGPHHLADLVLVGSHVPAARLARLARRPGLRMEADDLRWLRRLPSSTAVQVRAG